VSDKKKVLIITYYWPPSGGSGVQRWVKFTKYLRKYGWEPIIYTPSNPERPALDYSLEKDIPEDVEILTTDIWEPYTFYKKFVGLKKNESLGSGLMKSGSENSMLQKLAVAIRGNLFIPDARKFWINPSIKFLQKYLSDNPVDAIISSGPPHSMHMIAEKVSLLTKTPWIADFRDPWTNIDFFEDLHLSKIARSKHHKLEQRILKNADLILVVSPTMKKEFKELTDTPVSVITNGFDASDFENIPINKNYKFTISHVGMMTPTRNPEILWESIKELCDEYSEFKSSFQLQLIGKVDASIKETITSCKLEKLVSVIDYVPHSEIVRYQRNSDALLLIVNNTPNANLILTGKFFEYLAAERPILCISPVQGDMGEILKQTNSGELFTYDQKKELKKYLMTLFENWKLDISSYNSDNIHTYSREFLTQRLAQKLDTFKQ
jgi:glycosyltransferase involved in cell wall biosynthesis